MKIIEVLTTSILFLLPGALAPAFAQGQHEQQKQPEQKQQARPAQQPQRAAQQARPAQQPQRAAQQAKPAQQPQRAAETRQASPAQQTQHAARTQQARPAQQTQRQGATQQSRSGEQRQGASQQASRTQSGGGRGSIPEARFHESFGRDHTFHVNRDEFNGGSGRFQYGGYWFNVVDSWPAGWLYTDDVYVDYINGGYFLCDPYHPGVYISINIG